MLLKTCWASTCICFKTPFRGWPVIPILDKTIDIERQRKRHPTTLGNTWHTQPISMQSARRNWKRSVFHSWTSFGFSSQGTVISTRRTHLLDSDAIIMPTDRLVWIICPWKWKEVVKSSDIFHPHVPFSSLMLMSVYLVFWSGHSPFLQKCILRSLDTASCL